jgi:Bacteriophage lambda head decoration protein D
MPVFTEGRHAAEFVMSELPGKQSREVVTILTGQDLSAGTVLGKITASGKYQAVTVAAVDGSQNPVAVLMYPTDTTADGPEGAGDQTAVVIFRGAEINKNVLSYGADVDTQNEKDTILAALKTATNIIAR